LAWISAAQVEREEEAAVWFGKRMPHGSGLVCISTPEAWFPRNKFSLSLILLYGNYSIMP
jgi:hypothetical protein